MAQPQVFQGLVKSVLSGDTLVITSVANPSLERVFSLAFVTSPHIRKDADEPFAFQSREHLRDLAVGKEIRCTVLYKVPTTDREYGSAKLRDGIDLPDHSVAAGWLKIRDDAGRKEESTEVALWLDTLRAHEAHAKAERCGLWAGVGGVVELLHDLGDPAEFLAEWKGKTVDAVVERVLAGDRLLTRLLLTDTKHIQLITLLAGVRAPTSDRTQPSAGNAQPAEPFGNESKAFVERRLLQRQVEVLIVGTNPQGQLIASVLHPKGNIAELLVHQGLARCNDFHSTMLGDKMAALRLAEKEAQTKKLHIHHAFVAKTASDTAGQDFIVSKIVSADTILVRNKAGTVEKRIGLSSIRGPRSAEPSEAPFRDEAKEFVRKKLIGKHVHVSVDGKKPAAEGYDSRDVATVLEKGKNIGLLLVQHGLCSVIRHRKDDTDRAPNYDELLAAQETAQQERKGFWSGKPPKLRSYVDLSDSHQKAKVHLAALQRQRKAPAIVDFCKAGSRFTILIPRDGIKLTMVLSGVRAPRAPRLPQDKGDPFGQEALDLANRRCNQRDCEIDIHDIDKIGAFIGDLHINRESFAKILLEEGLASVHAYSAEKSGNAAELLAAEAKAKEARKGMWHDYDSSAEQNGDASNQPAATVDPLAANDGDAAAEADRKPPDYRDIVITSMDDQGKLKIQEIGSGTAALELLMRELRRAEPEGSTGATGPKVGDLVAARFSLDGQWYRARVRANDRVAQVAEVVYVDYGNAERQPWASLRPLDLARFGPAKLKPQAIDAALTLVQLPTAPEYRDDARRFVEDASADRYLVGCWDAVDSADGSTTAYLTVYLAAGAGDIPGPLESLNRDVVAAGHGMVPRRLRPWERARPLTARLASLHVAEAEAKASRRGMWEYGDITEDD